MKDYEIRIVARMEGLQYLEGSEVWNFDVNLLWSGTPQNPRDCKWLLYADGFSNDKFEVRALGDYERKVVVPRIIDYLKYSDGNKGFIYPVEVRYERDGLSEGRGRRL